MKEIETEKIRTKELCVGETCVNEAQLKDLLEKNNISAPGTLPLPSPTESAIVPTEVASSTPVESASSTPPATP